MNKMRLSLLLALNIGHACAEELEEATPPHSYESAEYFDDGDPYGLELKPPVVEKDTPTKRHVNVGNANVTVEVKNIDKLSESEAEWDRIRPKTKKPEEKKKSRFRDDKEEKKEDDNPEASISFKWSSR